VVGDTEGPVVTGTLSYTVEVATSSIDYLGNLNITDDFDDELMINMDDSEVNLNHVGNYIGFIFITDNNQNTTMVEITVDVVDTTPPIIIGFHDYTIEVLTPFIDYLGDVTAHDLYDGDISVTYNDSLVNLNQIGTYDVILSAIDFNGNSLAKTITITVVDTTPPDIIGLQNITVEVLTPSIDYLAGINIIDYSDVDIEVIDDNVNLNRVGTYEVMITAIDTSGNSSIESMTVIVLDSTNPIITGHVNYCVEVFTPYINYLENITVIDMHDDDLVIQANDSQVNLNEIGVYEVIITASDHYGNVGIEVITVEVVDTIAPIIYNYQDYTVEVNVSMINYTLGVIAFDHYEGMVTVNVDSSLVNLDEVGTYEVILIAMDTSNNQTSININVNVVDLTPPLFNHIEDRIVEVNTELVDYLEGIRVTDNLNKSVHISVDSSLVDLNQIGSYKITLIASDSAGNDGIKYYYLHVVDNIKPVISGYQDIKIKENQKFDPLSNITVYDNYDLDLLSELIVVGNYDVSKPGVYKIRLLVSDSSSNQTEILFNLIVKKDYQKEIVFGSIIGVGLIGIASFIFFKRKPKV